MRQKLKRFFTIHPVAHTAMQYAFSAVTVVSAVLLEEKIPYWVLVGTLVMIAFTWVSLLEWIVDNEGD
jgi:hypothetical protein